MTDLDGTAQQLAALSSGTTSVFDVIVQMNGLNQLEADLDVRTWILVRCAAMAASDAPAPSYEALVALCEGEDVDLGVAGALIAAGPVIGGPRLLTAALNLTTVVAGQAP